MTQHLITSPKNQLFQLKRVSGFFSIVTLCSLIHHSPSYFVYEYYKTCTSLRFLANNLISANVSVSTRKKKTPQFGPPRILKSNAKVSIHTALPPISTVPRRLSPYETHLHIILLCGKPRFYKSIARLKDCYSLLPNTIWKRENALILWVHSRKVSY